MIKKSKLIAIILCILLVEKTRSEWYRLPALVIPLGAAEGTCTAPGTCPSDSVKKVKEMQNIIIDNLNFTLVCGHGPWYPVAHINMSDPLQWCPSNWSSSVYSSNGIRTCSRRPSSTTGLIASCNGVFFFVGCQYNKICGRILGYKLGSVDAFSDPTEDSRFTPTAHAIDGMIDGARVDGVSITHGSPRNHIWTFAAGHDPMWLDWTCPCIRGFTGSGPQVFVGDHYFNFVNQATVVPLQSQLKAINSGMASNVVNVEPVVTLRLFFHGLSGSFLILQAMILKYAYVEMKALTMRTLQWSWWKFMFNNYFNCVVVLLPLHVTSTVVSSNLDMVSILMCQVF